MEGFSSTEETSGKTLNKLFYGDNIDILRKKIKDETVDLCYIDPPFNSKRNSNPISNIGNEDRAQAQAFTDTWTWDDLATAGYSEILANAEGRFQPQLVELIKGLHAVLKDGSLLAYLVSIALRVTEIHRVLKTTGSFYLHCDPTSSHYLKLILDAIFCGNASGEYQNEIVWLYTSGGKSKRHFARKHDVIFFYTKSSEFTFNDDAVRVPYSEKTLANYKPGLMGSTYTAEVKLNPSGKMPEDYWPIAIASKSTIEYLGYPTQKPEALLQRIIEASSYEGSVVLDAYCGCGTSVSVAQLLKRKWIGIDITYQSISLILRRIEKTFGAAALSQIQTDGIPRDMKSAEALAHKKDDRLRKEFEKWAVLTYTSNRAMINEKKGADAGIDAVAYFLTGKNDNAKIIFQVKSGAVKRGDIATLRGDMARENSALAVLITLEEPSKPMLAEAKSAGHYRHETMGRNYDKISIVTIKEIVDKGKRLEIPMSLEVVKAAQKSTDPDEQMTLL